MTSHSWIVKRANYGVPAIALTLVLGCGGGIRVLKYDCVSFSKMSDTYSECYVELGDCNSRIQITSSNGAKTSISEIDENWLATATERKGVPNFQPDRQSTNYRGNAISAHFVNGQLSSLALLEGAVIQVGDSDPLRLPATERKIRKVFGAPRRVSYTTGGPP
jgi:hypothetical protein